MGEMFGKELRRLRNAANLSRERLSRLTVSTGDLGISAAAIEALETKDERHPDDRTVVLLGRALAREGQQLAGLELAEARRLLDEQQVGHETALANLARIRPFLIPRAGAAPPELPAELGRFDAVPPPTERTAPRKSPRRARGAR